MVWIVLTVLLAIVAIGAFIFGTTRVQKVGVAAVCGLVWIVITGFFMTHTVGQREVGVVKHVSGSIGDDYKTTGWVVTAPWNHLETENIGIQKEAFGFVGSNSAVSYDQQPISAEVTMNYRVEPKDVIPLWKSVGPNWRIVLFDGRVPQDFKETTATFTSPQITRERSRLRLKTLDRLRRELCPRNSNGTMTEGFCIAVDDVFITNVGYSDAYTHAIEQKQVQVQQALQAQAKVKQSQAEASQAVAVAHGEATSIRVKARADADAIRLKGKALRNNSEVLRLSAIDKLNPNAQVIICTGNTCPSILPTGVLTPEPPTTEPPSKTTP